MGAPPVRLMHAASGNPWRDRESMADMGLPARFVPGRALPEVTEKQHFRFEVPLWQVRGRTFLGMGRDETTAVFCITEESADAAAAAPPEYPSAGPSKRMSAAVGACRAPGVPRGRRRNARQTATRTSTLRMGPGRCAEAEPDNHR